MGIWKVSELAILANPRIVRVSRWARFVSSVSRHGGRALTPASPPLRRDTLNPSHHPGLPRDDTRAPWCFGDWILPPFRQA
jgi:hypothetical protein